MIISRTPFRISFFGGGTDIPEWYNDNSGSVISTTIDKYCYLNLRYLPPFFDYKYRIRYFKKETVKKINEIKHPVVREALKYLKIDKGIEIVHNADLPARSGLGSSSTFTVCLLHALNTLKNNFISKKLLTLESIKIEQQMLKEAVGSQDQAAAAFGGFNRINFSRNNIEVLPITISKKRKKYLEDRLMLFFTGFSRNSSTIEKKKIKTIKKKSKYLNEMLQLVEEAEKIVYNENISINKFGKLLNYQWNLKKSLHKDVSNNNIDLIYKTAIDNGALGGKLLGSGGGGFILFYAPKKKHNQIKQALKSKMFVPFKFDNSGSQIVYFKNDNNNL